MLTSQTCRSCRRARGCWRGSQKRPWSFVCRRQAPRSPLHPPNSWSSTSARACPPTGMDTKASRTFQTESGNGETTLTKVTLASAKQLVFDFCARLPSERYGRDTQNIRGSKSVSDTNSQETVTLSYASPWRLPPLCAPALATGMSEQHLERTRLKSRKAKQRIMTPITGHPCVRKADSLPLLCAPALRLEKLPNENMEGQTTTF